MGAVLGAIIGVGLTLSIEGIVSQMAGGVDIVGGLMTIIGTALAGAGIGFAIGNVPGAIAGAVIGLVAGVIIEITGIKAAGEAAYAATEDFQTMTRILDECEDSANRSSFAMETLRGNIDNLTTSLSDVGAAQQLVDEIYAINENANASAYELELMATKVELLNGMNLEGLHLTIDETTGRVIETKEATDQLIVSLQKEAETAALQELLVQAYKDRYQAVADAEQAVKNINVAEQALAETERQLTNTPWWDLNKHAALTAQQEKQKETLEAANEARSNAITAYDELSGAIDTYSGALTNLSEPEASVGVQLEARMDSVRQTVEGVAADMPGYGRNIGEGLKNGMDENISSVSTLLKTFLDDTKTSTSKAWDDVAVDTNQKWGSIRTDLSGKFSEIDRDSSTGFKTIKTTITSKIDETMSDLQRKDWKSIGSGIVDGIMNGLKSIFHSLTSWAFDVWDSITGAFSSSNARSSVRNSAQSTPSRSYARIIKEMPDAFSAGDLPRLANGAVIPPNQQFAAILGDQRSGKNLEAPAGLIRQMVAEGMQAAMAKGGRFGRGGNMTVVLEVDKREWGRATVEFGGAEYQRIGAKLVEVRT